MRDWFIKSDPAINEWDLKWMCEKLKFPFKTKPVEEGVSKSIWSNPRNLRWSIFDMQLLSVYCPGIPLSQKHAEQLFDCTFDECSMSGNQIVESRCVFVNTGANETGAYDSTHHPSVQRERQNRQLVLN
jgi:hypothetical protein